MLSSILTLIFLATLTQALAFSASRPTPVEPVGPVNVPQPTDPPSRAELIKRQVSSTNTWITALFGTTNICGYVNGISSSSFYCGSSYTCDVILGSSSSASTSWGNVACCNEENCGIRYTCVDYEQYYTSSLCDADCVTDTHTAKCTALTAPYCNGVEFLGQLATDWYCDSNPTSTFIPAYTTDIEGDVVNFETLSWNPTSSSVASGASASSQGRLVSASVVATGSNSGAAPVAPVTVTVSASPSSPATTTTAAGGGPTGTAAASKKSTPVGAIAGGAAGGVVAIVAVLGLLWWFCWRKRKNNNNNNLNNNNINNVPSQQTGAPNQYQENDPTKLQPQMAQSELPGSPGGLSPGYFKPTQATGGHTVHEADSTMTSPRFSSRYSGATELETPGSPTPSHAVSAVASPVTSPLLGQQQPQRYSSGPPSEYHEMSATSGPWPQNLEGIHEMPGHQAQGQ